MTDKSEEWRIITGCSGWYEISDLGQVRLIRDGQNRILSPHLDGGGYPSVSLKLKKWMRVRVHKVVLETFVGPRPMGMVCCHGDGNPSNCRLDNLRWDTQVANTQDKRMHGRSRLGEDHHKHKLTEIQVLEIRKRPMRERKMAKHFGVRRDTLRAILTGRTWRHI